MSDLLADKFAIRETVESWVIYRDAGDWERFATVWHSDGWMTATWFQGPAKDFIEVRGLLNSCETEETKSDLSLRTAISWAMVLDIRTAPEMRTTTRVMMVQK